MQTRGAAVIRLEKCNGHIRVQLGKRDMVIDVALVHDFSGDCWRDLSRDGQPRYDDPGMLSFILLAPKCRSTARHGRPPAKLSTSGCIDGEFLRLLHILIPSPDSQIL